MLGRETPHSIQILGTDFIIRENDYNSPLDFGNKTLKVDYCHTYFFKCSKDFECFITLMLRLNQFLSNNMIRWVLNGLPPILSSQWRSS